MLYCHLLSSIQLFRGVQGLLRQNSEKRENSTEVLQTIKTNIEERGYAYISGPTMKLLLKEHDATEDDLGMLIKLSGLRNLLKKLLPQALMESGYIHERVPKDQQPGMKLNYLFNIKDLK